MSNNELPRPWFPGAGKELRTAARKLRNSGRSHALVIYICADAIAGHFKAVADAVESLCDVRVVGVHRLFRASTYDSAAVRIIYELTDLPSRLFPLFALSIDFSIKCYVENRLPDNRDTREVILANVLSDERIRRLELSEADVKTFYELLKLASS